MKIIDQSIIIEKKELDYNKLITLEKAARICYKSEGNFRGKPNETFLKKLIQSGHESILEHEKVTVKIITDRGVSHEIVRHRLASYSQESTRYCNYSQDKFGNELTFINNSWMNENAREVWLDGLEDIEDDYFQMLEEGATPQDARGILPNSLKTEMYVTMNFRAWRHFIKLRADKTAHPQIRELAAALYKVFSMYFAVIFSDLNVDESLAKNVDIVIQDAPAVISIQKVFNTGEVIQAILHDPSLTFQNQETGEKIYFSIEDETILSDYAGVQEIFTVDLLLDPHAKYKKI